MKKMPCLFVREFHTHSSFTITDQITPGCEWALEDRSVLWTRKWDGTACMIKGGILYKRYDAKKDRKTGEYKKIPEGAIPCSEPDDVTGHWPHWIAVGDEPESRWHREAVAGPDSNTKVADWESLKPLFPDGTYELCGPKINGNSERLSRHILISHSDNTIVGEPIDRAPSNVRAVVERLPWEGIVFHHPDGRMCKIRRHDFDLDWPVAS